MLLPYILFDKRHLLTAYTTPACRKLQHNHLATEIRKRNGPTVTLTDGRTVTLRRTGKLNAEMRFVRGQAHDSLYDMGFGAMMISVVTEDMTILLNEHGGVLDLEYRVEVEHALCSRNHYHIEIQTI